jgi:tetratricopeptide (TPR) repeat protein
MAQFLQDNPEDKHIYLDYITYGRALIKDKQPQAAIDALLKAEKKDPTKAEVHKELASAYENIDNYPAAVEQYEQYFKTTETPSIYDYLSFGQTNYAAATKYLDANYKSDIDFQSYIDKGNQAFSEVIERSPDHYIGYFWKARINSLVDAYDQIAKGEAMKGVAKPYYEKVLEVMQANNEDGKFNNYIVEAYDYLASYQFFVEKNEASAVDYYKKILAIDPTNAKALDVLKQLKIK